MCKYPLGRYYIMEQRLESALKEKAEAKADYARLQERMSELSARFKELC